METSVVKEVRDFFKSIKVTMSDGKEQSVSLLLKLDNDAWVDERDHELFWNDDKEVCYYFHFNQIRNTTPSMIGRDRVNVPAVISAFGYSEIQEIKARLTRDALEKTLELLDSHGVSKENGTDKTLDDKLKKQIYKKYIMDTDMATDYNYRFANKEPYK